MSATWSRPLRRRPRLHNDYALTRVLSGAVARTRISNKASQFVVCNQAMPVVQHS